VPGSGRGLATTEDLSESGSRPQRDLYRCGRHVGIRNLPNIVIPVLMTSIVNQNRVVHQRDLGPQASELALQEYNPRAASHSAGHTRMLCNSDRRSSGQQCRTWIRVLLSIVFSFSGASSAKAVGQSETSSTSAELETTAAMPQEAGGDVHSPASTTPRVEQEKMETNNLAHRGSIIVAPLPIVSPAIGNGIVPILGYIFPLSKNDKDSPPSTIGATGLITSNGSRAFGVGAQLFMKRDTYVVTAAYAHGNLNYNLYGVGFIAGEQGLKLPLEQSGQIFFGEVLRRIKWKIFAGARFLDGSSFLTLQPSTGKIPPIPPDLGIHTNLRALGFRIVRDTRPNHFYPITGTKLEFTGDFFAQALGSKYSFQRYKFSFNKFGSLSKNQVLAYDLFVCDTGGSPPFYGNCIYGTSNELRGYTAGQFIDRHMFTTQLEYRLSLPKRFGLAGFGGVGEVFPGASQLFRVNHLLPAVGGGPRYELSSKYHLNLRADFARARNSWTWSMGVGEAF